MESPNHAEENVIDAHIRTIPKMGDGDVLSLLREASRHEDIMMGVGLPSHLNDAAAREWLDNLSGPNWAITHGTSHVGAIFTRPVRDLVAPEYAGYREISTFILPPSRGLGLIYRVMPDVHNELSASGIPGLHAFTWQANHSPTRLWRKLGYSLLGRAWVSQGDYTGWKLIWAYPFSDGTGPS